MLVATSYLLPDTYHLKLSTWCLLIDTDNGEPHQIKTNQAKKENWLAVLSLAQLSPSLLPNFFLMTSHLNSHGTTDIKLEMLSSVKTGNGTPHYYYYY